MLYSHSFYLYLVSFHCMETHSNTHPHRHTHNHCPHPAKYKEFDSEHLAFNSCRARIGPVVPCHTGGPWRWLQWPAHSHTAVRPCARYRWLRFGCSGLHAVWVPTPASWLVCCVTSSRLLPLYVWVFSCCEVCGEKQVTLYLAFPK